MHQVTGEYQDDYNSRFKKRFYLNADQRFGNNWNPPIHWKGTVDGISVEFTQTERHGDDKDCYDWSYFPERLSSTIPFIVKAINDAMRIMD